MFVAFCVAGVNVIVPAFVQNGRLCARIDRAAILAAVGVPETACVAWGLEGAPPPDPDAASFASAVRAIAKQPDGRPWARPGPPPVAPLARMGQRS